MENVNTSEEASAIKVLMEAQFSSVCPVCQKEIIKGVPMIFETATGRAVHEDCDDKETPRVSAAEAKKMDARETRGKQIAQSLPIKRKGNNQFIVPSQSRGAAEKYVVDLAGEDGPTCTCLDFEERKKRCKHVHAVEYAVIFEASADESGPVLSITRVTRATYRQNWPIYDRAQPAEREHFAQLLRGLCEGIMQPRQFIGRPRHHLADVVFSLVWRAYSGKSLRRMMGELRDFQGRGLIETAPHFNTLSDYDGRADLTPVLRVLIEESALPLSAVESQFAADSSGFSSSKFARWYDAKYGREHAEKEWVKCHLMVGTKTHVVTGVTVTRGAGDDTSDCSQFDGLLQQTACNFDVKEVSADKAYLSRDNLAAVVEVGGTPYIPFKINSQPGPGQTLWKKMLAYFEYRRDEWAPHYHRRSNVETVFSMIKRKFGDFVRSKGHVAQENEVLCKVLAHNLCVLVMAMYELEIAPQFFKVNS